MTPSPKQTLAWFGFGSLAVVALATPANANTTPLREIVFTAPEAIADAPTEVLDCTCSQTDTSDAWSDEVDVEGELAIENLGCDCAGCRNVVRQMLEASTLRPGELR